MKEHNIISLRRAGVPLVGWETADQIATIQGCLRNLNGKADKTPAMQWDLLGGLRGVNQLGDQTASELSPNGPIESGNPSECLRLLQKSPEKSLVFFHNSHRLLEDPGAIQGICNLRDVYKAQGSTLILLAPSLRLPSELSADVVVVSEALPGIEDITAIVDSICKDAGLNPDKLENKANILDTLLGLSAFAAEQCLALSIIKTGIDRDQLWERKRKMIEQTPGLSVWRGGECFEDIGGCENVKGFLRRIMSGRRAPRAIAFIDEIEKTLAGTAGDTSGVSQDYLGALLSFMQDREAAGCIFIGPPGAAKSVIAKAAGNEANIPTIQFDLGAMKGSLVGESERRLREALKVLEAVSQGQTLFIATCNSFGNLPPELKRRFTLGTFFFDLPDPVERESIWKIYGRKYELPVDDRPQDTGWTGAEIKQCCNIAWRLGCKLTEAADFIVPVSKSAAETIEGLRKQANGKFISAAVPGTYQYLLGQPSGRRLER